MRDAGHFNPQFTGGQFRWWVGQVAPAKNWKGNQPNKLIKNAKGIPGWGYRYKVRIIGLHDQDEAVLPSKDLPWAQVMYGVTDGGGQRGQLVTPAIAEGNFVFGFFLDGDEEQVPIIMGILGHNQKTKIETIAVTNYGASSAWSDQGVVAGDSTIKANKSKNGEVSNTDGAGGEGGGEILRQGTDAVQVETSGDEKQKAILKREHAVDCAVMGEQPEVKGMQLAIQNMTKEIAQLQKSLNSFPSAISLPIVKLEKKIDDVVDKYTGEVTKNMNTILNKIEQFSAESLTNKLIGKIASAAAGDASKLSKEQLERRKTLACILGKTRGSLGNLVKAGLGRLLSRRRNKSGGFEGQNQLTGNGSDMIPALPPDGFYYPNNPCESEEVVAEILAETLASLFDSMNDTQLTTVSSIDSSSTLAGSSRGGIGGAIRGIRSVVGKVGGVLGKLNSLGNFNLSSLLPMGALGGKLSNLSGMLGKLSGFGALNPANFDVALAMSFVSGISAFQKCIPKPGCSKTSKLTADGGEGSDGKGDINPANIAKGLKDKIDPSNKSVFENLTEGQKNRILASPIGENVEGLNVSESLKAELRAFELNPNISTIPLVTDTDLSRQSNFNVFENLTDGQKTRILNSPIGVDMEGLNVTEKIKFELREFEQLSAGSGEEDKNLVKTFKIPTFNKPKKNEQPLSFSEFRAGSNTRGFYNIPSSVTVNTNEFIVSEERGYQLLSEIDTYSGNNSRLKNFRDEKNELIYQAVYGGTGVTIDYNGKIFNPGDDGYNNAFVEIRKIINDSNN